MIPSLATLPRMVGFPMEGLFLVGWVKLIVAGKCIQMGSCEFLHSFSLSCDHFDALECIVIWYRLSKFIAR